MAGPICKARREEAQPAPMPAVRDPVQTQRRILRAARNEFMHHGYSGARIERISRAAGIDGLCNDSRAC